MMRRASLRDLKRLSVLQGAVLRSLLSRLGSREAVFEFLGLAEQVRAGNHHRTWRREVGRLQALLDKVGEVL